jgi:hypothetical protein
MTMYWTRGAALLAVLGLAGTSALASVPARTRDDGLAKLRIASRPTKPAAKQTASKLDTLLVRAPGRGGFGGARVGGFGRGGFARAGIGGFRTGGFGRVGFARGFGFNRVGFNRGFGFNRFAFNRGFGFNRFAFNRGFGFNRFAFNRGFNRFAFNRGWGWGWGRRGWGWGWGGFGLGLGLGSLLGYPSWGWDWGYPYYGDYGYGYSPYDSQAYSYPGYSYSPYYSAPTIYSYPAGGSIGGATGDYVPPIMPPAGDGTFPYDGGPSLPVPLPQAGQPVPQVQPPVPSGDGPGQAAPAQGRIVSVPAAPKTKFAYPAYGEKSPVTSFAQDRVVPVKRQPVEAARR